MGAGQLRPTGAAPVGRTTRAEAGSFHVVTDNGVYEVTYNGKGTGYEEVAVNEEVVCRLQSLLWYQPQFNFTIGNANAQINVKVSGLLQITSFNLIVGGAEIYSE